MRKTRLVFWATIFISFFCFFQLATPQSAFAAGEVAIDDPNIAWSPYGWVANGNTYKQSPTVGSYVDLAFTGTTLGLNVDVSFVPTPVNVKVAAFIDGNTVPILKSLADVNSNQLIFSSSLSSGNHYAQIVIASNANNTKWTYSGGPPTSMLRINSIQLSPSGSLHSVSQTPLNKLGPKIIYYGDSISEGNGLSGTYGYDSQAAIVGKNLNANFGIHGYSSLTWWLSVVSNTPDFYYLTSDSPNYSNAVWNNYYKGESLLNNPSLSSSGYKEGVPDAVFNNLGINDVSIYGLGAPFGGANALNLFKNHISEWLSEERSALGARPAIFMVMPFNYNCTTTSNPSYNSGNVANLQLYRQAWLDTINDYKASYYDSRVFVIDLGEDACSTVVANSLDGLHPDPVGAKIIGDQISSIASQNIILNTPLSANANGQTLTNGIEVTNPTTYTGTAPALSAITVTVQPGNKSCSTTVNIDGNWSCTFYSNLEPGSYSLSVESITTYGQRLDIANFVILIQNENSVNSNINNHNLATTGINTNQIYILTALNIICSSLILMDYRLRYSN